MEGKIALVTGAASGVGAALAQLLTDEKMRVVLCDINEIAGEELATRLVATYIKCDVSDYDMFKGVVAECIERVGVPDYAALNAGVMTVGPDRPVPVIEEVTLEQYRRVLGINLGGVFNGLSTLIPHMRDKGGCITATSSIAGLMAVPMDALYSASKHAVVGLIRSVAAENENSNLRFNCMCPGGVDTAIIPDSLREAGYKGMPPAVMANEILDMLKSAPSGEVRVKTDEYESAFMIDDLQLGD